MKNALVISVEGVGQNLIGGYGSNTAITPNLDQMIARSFVFDNCYLDSVSTHEQLISLWTSTHAFQRGNHPQLQAITQNGDMHVHDELGSASLWKRVASQGLQATFLTDSPVAARLAESLGCPEVLLIDVVENCEAVTDSTECNAAELFWAAGQWMNSSSRQGLVWIHSRGLNLPWDAPLELRSQFIDPEDPEPPSDVSPPVLRIDKSTDPDLVVGWGQVAAAQVCILDEAIGSLLQLFSNSPADQSWLQTVLCLGGVPLGESGKLGRQVPVPLRQEQLNCAWMVNVPGVLELGRHRAEICQLPDVGESIANYLIHPAENSGSSNWGRDVLEFETPENSKHWPPHLQLAVTESEAEDWVRCPAWSLLRSKDGLNSELFVKPDDRWEVSNIASRRPDIVDRLWCLLEEFRKATLTHQRGNLLELEEDLCSWMR
ncbi:MAG: hypothetical protein KDB03_21490 [Planctomycetales bacterium]|nr:hypothetical protein [Planctomycetales bacterium]